jgi:hypothetical protein
MDQKKNLCCYIKTEATTTARIHWKRSTTDGLDLIIFIGGSIGGGTLYLRLYAPLSIDILGIMAHHLLPEIKNIHNAQAVVDWCMESERYKDLFKPGTAVRDII